MIDVDTVVVSKICGKGRFQFKEFWLSKEGCHEIVTSNWGMGDIVHNDLIANVANSIHQCGRGFQAWKNSSNFNLNVELRAKINQLNNRQSIIIDLDGFNEVKSLEKEVGKLLEQKELYWRQQSRAT